MKSQRFLNIMTRKCDWKIWTKLIYLDSEWDYWSNNRLIIEQVNNAPKISFQFHDTSDRKHRKNAIPPLFRCSTGSIVLIGRQRLNWGELPEFHPPILELITALRDSVVGLATGYGLDDWGIGVRVPAGQRIFSSPRRPDGLWGRPSLLCNGYRGLFPSG
jgi:hypothetical protein